MRMHASIAADRVIGRWIPAWRASLELELVAQAKLGGKLVGGRESLIGGQDPAGLIEHDGRRNSHHTKGPCHPGLFGCVDSDDPHPVASTHLQRGKRGLLGSPAGGAAWGREGDHGGATVRYRPQRLPEGVATGGAQALKALPGQQATG